MDRILVGSDEITIHVSSAENDGVLFVGEVAMPPGGGPPALHRHPVTEVYMVDRGEFTIYLEDDDGAIRRIVAAPRTVVHIASGRAHTVRNESEAPSGAYVAFSPGAAMEAFLRAAGKLAADGPPDMQAVLALAARHGIEMAGPVPAAA
jgi:oxalate decarboxylase/phosphoglucose isomerase-like protein (cupin superfamily)